MSRTVVFALAALLLSCTGPAAPASPSSTDVPGTGGEQSGGAEGAGADGVDHVPERSEPVDPRTRAQWPELQTSLPTYGLSVGEEDWQLLINHPQDKNLRVPATFVHQGRQWEVTLRLRGKVTRSFPKKSFQVRFPDDDPFQGGVKRLELLAEWDDGAMLTQKLWYDLAAAAGVPAPRATYVRLHVNGAFYGVMVDLESVRKAFLVPHGFDHDSDLYRCGLYGCEMREPPGES
jgi:spore coat protein H